MKLADEYFRLLVESVKDYAIYLIDPAGIIQSWNAGAERLKGYRADEVIGEHFSRFFSAEDRANKRPDHLLATALAEGRTEDIGWRVRKDGSQFWANVVITALHDANGTHIGFAKVTRDLTDRSYRAFVEATHSIVWTTSARGLPNADSPTWREFTGQSEQEWFTGHAWDPVHPADRQQMIEAWGTAKQQGTPFAAEFRLARQGGTYVWMGTRAVPFHNPDGSIREWFGVTFDISDRKLAEAERERATELLATTLRSIGDAVIATDTSGRVTFMNVVAEKLTAWTSAEASGRALAEVFPIFNEETGAPAENPVDKVLRDGVIVGLANHTVLRRRDGSEVAIDDSAAPIRGRAGLEGVVLVFRDASEEKRELYRRRFLARAAQQITEANDFRDALRQIVQLACPRMADWAAVDILEPATGKLSRLALAHVDPAKIELAQRIAERYPPDPNAPRGVAHVIRTGEAELYPALSKELLERAAVDAEHLQLIRELDLRSALVVPLRGRAGVFGAITFVFAASDRRYTQQDLELAQELASRVALLVERRRVEEEAERGSQMKDEFLATISHELRTPLQAIMGYASMLERQTAPDPAKAIAAIARNAHAQARLIEDMLDMSRILTGKLRLATSDVELGAAIEAAVAAVRPAAAAKDVRIVEKIAPDLGKVRADFERLQQIVWNLVSNAVKFTPRQGTVEVIGERIGSSLHIVVRDTGKGIAPEHLGTIFERFRQVDSSSTRVHAGLGLGLAIAKYLVEAHGGTIQVESEGLGKGATFTVTLPARFDAVSQAPPPAIVEATASLAGIRVLVVDDDDDTRGAIADALESAGARVEQAGSARDAFAAFTADPPDVLLSDIGMPLEDGYSLLARIRQLPRERGGAVPAIALTAYARPEDLMKSEAAGFQRHLAKPVSLEQLIDSVRGASTRPEIA